MTTNGKGARVLSILGVALILSSGLLAQNKTKEERREEANSRTVQGLSPARMTSPSWERWSS